MTTTLHVPLARYAARLHAGIGDRHHVASPLGAWLLLALAAPAATGGVRAELEDALGVDAATAADLAATLVDAPHPLVPSATAVWHRAGFDPAPLANWRATLPRRTETGPLPDQAGLDAWARENTLGLIDRFPLTVSPRVLLALASALATRISWADPFDLVPGTALGATSPWAGRLGQVLRAPKHGHRAWIAPTGPAGDVAVHAASAVTSDDAGLVVVSVAADPTVGPAAVLAAAYEMSAAAVDDAAPTERRSLFDLPLGDGPAWSLREEPVHTFAPGGREERHSAVLPCWSASDEHDLAAATLGFPAVARGLGGLLGMAELGVEVRQAAMARYGRYGFEAAAVTGAFALMSMPPPGVARIAELRFGHPYAVVAVAVDRRGGTGPWHGVPVFSAWVADPEEPAATDLADPPEA
ncbi:hypothetical protein E1193_20430 [Micromonospora sp. KC606]|uniref:hypothetical protein n=1 Tax=Micromonospora sp. KC606 TaxID=2530379 RepID=UPI0010536135|nr:hypothetical protein [Micromonospora sp. KC606]TDC78619.1 hypothetical protein E1193_20430 [Micromonospora sp. KC606]